MVTKEQALTCNTFVELDERGYAITNKRGAPIQWRRNGRTQLWARDAGRFYLPVKCGLRHYSHIGRENAHYWAVLSADVPIREGRKVHAYSGL